MKASIGRLPTWPLVRMLFLALLAMGIISRIFGIFTDFWFDEIWTYFGVIHLNSPLEVFTRFNIDNNHFLNSLLFYFIGNTNHWFIYRIPSLVAGILTIPLVWLSVRQAGRLEALIASVFISASFLMINYSSEARGYALVIFFAIGTFYILQRCASNNSIWWRLLLWLCLGLGMLSNLIFIFVFIASIMWFPFQGLQDHKKWFPLLGDWFACFGIPVVLSGLFYLYIIRFTQIGGGFPYTIIDVIREALSYAGGAGRTLLPVSIFCSILTGGLFLSSIFLLWKEGRSEWFFFLIAIVIAPALLLFFISPKRSFRVIF